MRRRRALPGWRGTSTELRFDFTSTYAGHAENASRQPGASSTRQPEWECRDCDREVAPLAVRNDQGSAFPLDWRHDAPALRLPLR